MTFPSKKELRRRYNRAKRLTGDVSVSDAQDAYGLGVIGKREYERVKKKHSKHALN